MEASGFSDACHQEDKKWLVIRGVSDFGDKSKNDEHHRFAAQMATAATRDFIERGLSLSLGATRRRAVRISSSASLAVLKRAAEQLPTSRRPEPRGPAAVKLLELSRPLEAKAYRLVPAERFHQSSPHTTRQISSRFGTGIFYLALSEEAAVEDVMMNLRLVASVFPRERITRNYLMTEFDVRLSFVLDLTDAQTRRALSISPNELQDLTFARSVADTARTAGCEAIRYNNPRTRHLLLAVFDRIAMSSMVRFIQTRPFQLQLGNSLRFTSG